MWGPLGREGEAGDLGVALGRPPPGPLGSPLYPRPQPDQPGHIAGTRKGNLGPVFFKSFFGMTGSAWSVGNNVEGLLSHRHTNRDARRVSRFSWSPSMSMSVREPWALCTVRACVRLQSQGEQRRRLSPPRTFQARSEDSAPPAEACRASAPTQGGDQGAVVRTSEALLTSGQAQSSERGTR